MKIKFIIILVIFFIDTSFSQDFIEKEILIPSKKVTVNGTLLSPSTNDKVPLVIIIPGSGINDRDGNQVGGKANSLKFLAEGLATYQIATYRYDKSTIALLKKEDFKEEDVTFDDFIDDAIAVVDYFKDKKQFSKVIFAGHSQGSLVAMLASKSKADAYISIAGAGRPIDEVLTEQILAQSSMFKDDLKKTFDLMRSGKIDENFNPMLISIFRKSLQPFWISWMKYNPLDEIKKLEIPVLIINGTKDIQVSVSDAELLHKANNTSELQIIELMNHIFKEVKGDRSENIGTYNNSELPIMEELVTVITKFVTQIK
ncbi:MAG: alpha/beta hydrolase [Flavobacteriaceae bacterium]|nr:alpha/beta hydrolase [Flavobacteriaceae bacterium]